MIESSERLFDDEELLLLLPDEIEFFDDVELLDTLAAARRLSCRLEALQTRLLARFQQVRGEDAPGVDDEIGFELHCTRHAAADRIAVAQQLVGRHPVLLDAMSSGVLDGYSASRVVELTNPLSDEQAREVESQLAGRLDGDHTEIRRIARRIVHAVDPDGAVDRAKHARGQRKVTLASGEDAVSRLIADLPSEVASAAYASIDTEARRLRVGGEQRTLDQLRADIFGQRLIGGGGSGSPRVQVMLHMPIATALAVTDDGCELDGYGPVPGPIARQIMADPNSTWRKVICDPATGAVLDLGRRRYRPSQAIRDIVTARDRECAMPGCYRPAIHAAFDHIHSFATGGGTSVENAAPQCEYHNNLKEHPQWGFAIDREANTVTIATPAGRRYTRERRAVLKPRPPTPELRPQEQLPDKPPF